MAMKIARVEPGSEAEVLGLGPGDELLNIGPAVIYNNGLRMCRFALAVVRNSLYKTNSHWK